MQLNILTSFSVFPDLYAVKYDKRRYTRGRQSYVVYALHACRRDCQYYTRPGFYFCVQMGYGRRCLGYRYRTGNFFFNQHRIFVLHKDI